MSYQENGQNVADRLVNAGAARKDGKHLVGYGLVAGGVLADVLLQYDLLGLGFTHNPAEQNGTRVSKTLDDDSGETVVHVSHNGENARQLSVKLLEGPDAGHYGYGVLPFAVKAGDRNFRCVVTADNLQVQELQKPEVKR